MITVVGGVYVEQCVEPFWSDVYGSAGRAAAAISAAATVTLVTYRAAPIIDGLENLSRVYRLNIDGPEVPEQVSFAYMH